MDDNVSINIYYNYLIRKLRYRSYIGTELCRIIGYRKFYRERMGKIHDIQSRI